MKTFALPAAFAITALAALLTGPLVAGRPADVDAVETMTELETFTRIVR